VLLHRRSAQRRRSSAALGFWAAEALTLAGGFFWWLRAADYKPAYCRVDGVQVDYDEAARAAVSLETDEDRAPRRAGRRRAGPGAHRRAALHRTRRRHHSRACWIGGSGALVIARRGLGADHQVLGTDRLAHALRSGFGGSPRASCARRVADGAPQIRGWTAAVLLATRRRAGADDRAVPIRRDVFHDRCRRCPVLAGAGVAR
jgi:hypothetical protein